MEAKATKNSLAATHRAGHSGPSYSHAQRTPEHDAPQRPILKDCEPMTKDGFAWHRKIYEPRGFGSAAHIVHVIVGGSVLDDVANAIAETVEGRWRTSYFTSLIIAVGLDRRQNQTIPPYRSAPYRSAPGKHTGIA
jgi:hypothetical protein